MHAEDIESYRDYRQYVEQAVDYLLESFEEDADEGDLSELVFEAADSDRIIMFYSNNLKVLDHSENEPEEWKHMVGEDEGYRRVLQIMAFDVFRQDLWEELDRRDVWDER